ncbi:hypothetical protein JD276_01325 [Leucobacter sp. CSA1]|uniref:LGFP repeat-containing protein n=1 Tax=Leucobacter chromiisoli TaxID=2796471 RepID=A0A934UU06_9MICO|nr:hypothetical protein [Leucobacter chromiisoli]MBK0417678.1 hypothetical protein [Leucobacter chromiisoli]
MSRRSGYPLLALFTALLVAFSLMQAPPAHAANVTDGFDPGNIISDENFYGGNAMSASQVQSFLNQRVPDCTIGDPGRAPGSAWGSTRIANNCLRDFRVTTQSRPANAYCGAYGGVANETAASIIARVGQACGISQRVLLIMLEKEQSLVTDTWPTVRQFDVAMGYACPDSGPGGSANCDSAYYGFFNQVYRAAWQLKVYRAHPNSYNYKPFQSNRIQWHPNIGCGTSNVYIENWATAALYIYTPYRPNQAALNAGWGTGDACSSYGNRNFYNFYKTWFGNPKVDANYPKIDEKRAQNSWLGAPTSEYNYYDHNGGGVVRAFENGAVAWRSGTSTAFILTGDFRTYFSSQGGITGRLGWPTSDQQEWDRGRTQGFQGGAVSSSAEHGFATVTGSIRGHYAEWALAYNGPLGWPTGEQVCTTSTQCSQNFENGRILLSGSAVSIRIPQIDSVATSAASKLGAVTQSARAQAAHGGGFVQAHKNGAIAWSKATGAHIVAGDIRKAYGSAGGVSGQYGWPTSDQVCVSDGSCSQNFVGGTIQVDGNGNVVSMTKDVRDAYEALKKAGIDLGKSLGDTQTVSQGKGGRVHAFENGAIAASDRTGAYAVMAPIRAPFASAGGLGGALGWPTGNSRVESANGGGTLQGFEGGAITSTASGSYVLSGVMRTAFGAHGGLTGTLGWPQSNAVQHTVKGGGSVQAFQGGALVQRNGTTVPVLLDGEIRKTFGAAGGLAGTPGWPTGEARTESANGGGVVQGFQNAAIASSVHGTFMVTGEIRSFYSAQGGLSGALGWPTSAATKVGNEERQSFQGGTIVHDLRTGVSRIEAIG